MKKTNLLKQCYSFKTQCRIHINYVKAISDCDILEFNMRKFLFIIFLPLISYANYTVIALKGKVFFNGLKVKKDMILNTKGILKTASNSYVRIQDRTSLSYMNLGADSELNVETNHSKARPTLVSGMVRFIASKGKNNFVLRTTSAGFGVRGTDFLVLSNKLLNETEIITFEGQVKFQSFLNKKDSRLLKKNQWGGLGGRFGQSIGEVLDLPTDVVQHFAQLSSF